jgi:hypothetical protein
MLWFGWKERVTRDQAGGPLGESPEGGVSQDLPGDAVWDGCEVAGHFGYELDDGVAGVFGFSLAFEAAVDEELQEVEDEHPDAKDCLDGIRGVAIDSTEVPVLDPLAEAGVFEVPS